MAAMLCAVAGCRPADPPPRADQVLQADAGHAWFRGNLHAHSLWSDGDEFPESVVEWYRRNGYQFLSLTDHNLLQQEADRWVAPRGHGAGEAALARARQAFAAAPETRLREGRLEARLRRYDELERRFSRPGEFLLLPGEEISDAVGPVSVHLNAINIARAVEPAREPRDVNLDIARNAAAAMAAARDPAGVLLQLNHPNFLGAVTAEQLMRLEGTSLFEVYNGHPLSNNLGDGLYPPVETLWDTALAWRLEVLGLPLLYGTATDDSHSYGVQLDASPGRGWVEVLAEDLSAASLFSAMRAGRFYASTGVRLRRIVGTDDRLEVEVDPVPGEDYTIEFIGTRAGFDAATRAQRSATGRPLYASGVQAGAIGQVFARHSRTRAVYRFAPDDLYVRARVTSSRRHPNPSQPLQHQQAWIQPIPGPAARALARRPLQPPAPSAVELAFGVTRRFAPMAGGEAARLVAAPAVRCGLDILQLAGQPPGTPRPTTVVVAGWLADTRARAIPRSVAVVLQGEGGRDFVAETGVNRYRPDVAQGLADPAFEGAGYQMEFELADVPTGKYRVQVVGFLDGKPRSCDSGKVLDRI